MRFRWSWWRFVGVLGVLGRFNWYSVRMEGGGGGIFGVLWRFDVCIWLFMGVRVDLGVFGRKCWGRFGSVEGVLWDVWVCWGRFGGCWGHFWEVLDAER